MSFIYLERRERNHVREANTTSSTNDNIGKDSTSWYTNCSNNNLRCAIQIYLDREKFSIQMYAEL